MSNRVRPAVGWEVVVMAIEMEEAENFAPNELLGASIQRREDPHLITGDAEYTDDIQYRGEVHLAIVRSQYGHAGIESIDTSAAEAMDSVLAVYTQEDIEAAGIPGTLRVDSPDNGVAPEEPLLARDAVVYQGQPIAGVVATDRYSANEAAEAVDVSYERKDAVIDPVAAIEEDETVIHSDAPDNVAFEWETGDEAAANEALGTASRVVDVDLEINRVLPTAMEPRAAVARYRSSTGELSMEVSTQVPDRVQNDLSTTLGIRKQKIRVRPPDVGGGFGAKLQPYTGYLLVGWCAKELGRPVKWVARRTEDCQSMIHSRHHIVHAQVGVELDGEILGMHVETTVPVGGFLVPGGSGVPTNLGVMANGQYDIPGAYVQTRGAFTNTAPLAAYRGAGRPEATYFIERLIRTVADELGLDPTEVRKRNFIPPEVFPFETGLGRTYDNGEYAETLEKALEMVEYDAFREQQAELREDGRYVGIGFSCYVEACGASPGWSETGVVQVTPDGSVVVKSGTTEIGTGHQTAYTQLAANELGVSFDDVEVIEGDTAHVLNGGGTAGSRAMPVGGSAVLESATKVKDKAREIAAHQLEASTEDIEVGDAGYQIRGVPERAVTLAEIAEAAYDGDVPEGMEPGLEATSHYDPPNYTFPYGTHVAMVEVEPETGEITIDRYLAIDDVGNQINPKIVEGQVLGGVVQGLGQAMYENVEYDENGNLISGSLQDYAIPKAEHVPELEWDSTVTPCPHNLLGVKGVGEAGAIAAPPAIVNAVVDALGPLGITNLDMPLTPERVWNAIENA